MCYRYNPASAATTRRKSFTSTPSPPCPSLEGEGRHLSLEVKVPAEDRFATKNRAAAMNRNFYDGLWSGTKLARPERFNTWPLVNELLPSAPSRLEIGPGLRPRLPIAGTHFLDISTPVIRQLNSGGGIAGQGDLCNLPYLDARFDLVCAFDVIEHVEDDSAALAQITRVLKDDGIVICSVPLHRSLWTPFDDFVGHVRRYDLRELENLLERHRLVPEKNAVFGMQPSNPRLLEWGIWFLTHRRSTALFWYNLFHPLALRFQKPLIFSPGLDRAADAAEIVLICRRGRR
jgi:SAM-dependent methyltransferase